MISVTEFKKDDPDIGVSSTGDRSSFAYETARTRWPKILDNAVAELSRAISNDEAIQSADAQAGRDIAAIIASFKEDILSDASIKSLLTDGASDIHDYNAELQSIESPKWLDIGWLYAECYMYRWLYLQFSTAPAYWKNFDLFVNSKCEALVSSKAGAIELVRHFTAMLDTLSSNSLANEAQEKRKALLEEMLQISLWGNATDLSLLTTLSVDELQSRQGKKAREASKANVIVNDTGAVWDLLEDLRLRKVQSTQEIHIVLDNAGFELLTDLVLASYLIMVGYASKVVLHGKRMPWFVSDVNKKDLDDLVDGFASSTTYVDASIEERVLLQRTGQHWQSLLQQKIISFQADPFWTTAHPYGRLAVIDPKLYSDLAHADLVIYKGDLNYRKLTYDGMWPHTTSFEQAIGPLARKDSVTKLGLRTLALRTCKADVAVGLKPGLQENLPLDWTRTGKYGLISYWDGRV